MATECISLDLIPELRRWEMSILYSCDIWPVSHILAPFLVALFTKSPLFGFLMSGIWEIVEIIALMIFGNYGFYAGPQSATHIETFAESLVDDWLIHGFIASVVAWVFIHTLNFPLMINYKEFWSNIYRFWYYILALVALLLCFFDLYPISINTHQLPGSNHLHGI